MGHVLHFMEGMLKMGKWTVQRPTIPSQSQETIHSFRPNKDVSHQNISEIDVGEPPLFIAGLSGGG